MRSDTTTDRLAIRDIVENWVLWRDARQWERFRTLWHADGRMWATWFQGTFKEFIAVSQQGYERGARYAVPSEDAAAGVSEAGGWLGMRAPDAMQHAVLRR